MLKILLSFWEKKTKCTKLLQNDLIYCQINGTPYIGHNVTSFFLDPKFKNSNK